MLPQMYTSIVRCIPISETLKCFKKKKKDNKLYQAYYVHLMCFNSCNPCLNPKVGSVPMPTLQKKLRNKNRIRRGR